MLQALGEVELKNGERVQAGVLRGPCPSWQERISQLLGHKGGLWNEHIKRSLLEDLELETRFYLLLRGEEPIANIMTTERVGVGLVGHVFTAPTARQLGCASALFAKMMGEVKERGSRCLLLGTAYDSPAYHIYRKCGFSSIEPGSGVMSWYSQNAERFATEWFAPGATEIEPVGWRHWPTSSPLTAGPFPGAARLTCAHLVGRKLTEGPLLPLIMDNLKRAADAQPARALALRQTQTQAVVGLAAFGPHPVWPQTTLADVYCHPDHWAQAAAMMVKLRTGFPANQPVLAYCSSQSQHRREALMRAGFRPAGRLPAVAALDCLGAQRVALDVLAIGC